MKSYEKLQERLLKSQSFWWRWFSRLCWPFGRISGLIFLYRLCTADINYVILISILYNSIFNWLWIKYPFFYSKSFSYQKLLSQSRWHLIYHFSSFLQVQYYVKWFQILIFCRLGGKGTFKSNSLRNSSCSWFQKLLK